MGNLILAAIAFVGGHLLLSHTLRAQLVARTGGRGFLILYSLVATITLGWLVLAARAAPPMPPVWFVGEAGWWLATATMWLASMLPAGSLVGNPVRPDPAGTPRVPEAPRGVYAVTRHPMMWSFAIWAVVHVWVWPGPDVIVVALAILVLALVGSLLQDARKRRSGGAEWGAWQAQTSWAPFAALSAERVAWRAAIPAPTILEGGIGLWLAASWAHRPLGGVAAGIWR